ncbi:PP2C-like domain-containing protein CG9801 [Ornithodoros turicata]|uniref:PP2C-like domain-containing protein CG9801 n=1 Tax=Ornithodoros turicata TaxID=34597 RepID=UPI0031388D0D
MPTLRDKVADFLRQLSSGAERSSDPKPECTSPTASTFIQRYLNGEDLPHQQPEIVHGKSCHELPSKQLAVLSPRLVAAFTGPTGGLTQVNKSQKAFTCTELDVDFIDEDDGLRDGTNAPETPARRGSDAHKEALDSGRQTDKDEIAGITNWNCPAEFAYGIATTLYERHPVTKENAGEPIADSFALCVRENSAILALADGVNWGEKACLAARCAVHGCVDYLNRAIYGQGTSVKSTAEVFVCLLRSFQAAHNLILQEQGMLTTLCAAVACQLYGSQQYVVCTCNVGDSLAYLFSKRDGVREITLGSHDIHSMRDMRDALGALGPVDGQNPELGNLTIAMTLADPGDVLFLTSDGISDNFDPVVGKFAVAKKEPATTTASASTGMDGLTLPIVEAHQRHALTLLRMQDLLEQGLYPGDGVCRNAEDLCERMVEFATRLTVAKRRLLEDPELYKGEGAPISQRTRRQRLAPKLALVPGKLDHASIVAYQIGGPEDARNRNINPTATSTPQKTYPPPDNFNLESTV